MLAVDSPLQYILLLSFPMMGTSGKERILGILSVEVREFWFVPICRLHLLKRHRVVSGTDSSLNPSHCESLAVFPLQFGFFFS